MSQKIKTHCFKIVLLGKGYVGKTSLTLRYCENKFNENQMSTLQASFLTKRLSINGTIVKLSVWDTAGQERFHALGPIYYRESNGAVIVYDVTNPESLIKAKKWVEELRRILGKTICLALVGNKCDLLTEYKKNLVSNPLIADAIAYCKTLDKAEHYLTSAKLNKGLDEMFFDLTKRIIAYKETIKPPSNRIPSINGRVLRIEDDENFDFEPEVKKCNC